MNITRKWFIHILALCTLSGMAQASELDAVQRNCPDGDDLFLYSDSIAVSTHCIWQPSSDKNMSITLNLGKDVPFVSAHCEFTPVTRDTVKEIMVSKSGNADGSPTPKAIKPGYSIINKTDIQFIVRNYYSKVDKDGMAHVNVLFYLNQKDFSAGDQISCSFAPVRF